MFRNVNAGLEANSVKGIEWHSIINTFTIPKGVIAPPIGAPVVAPVVAPVEELEGLSLVSSHFHVAIQ